MDDDLPSLMRKIYRIVFFFLFLDCLGWAIWPSLAPIFGGYLVGAAGSLVILWHLAWKTAKVAALATSGRRSRSGFGFLSRAALALLAAVISVRTLGYSAPATVAGLITAPLATLVLGLIASFRRKSGHSVDERGENN